MVWTSRILCTREVSIDILGKMSRIHVSYIGDAKILNLTLEALRLKRLNDAKERINVCASQNGTKEYFNVMVHIHLI